MGAASLETKYQCVQSRYLWVCYEIAANWKSRYLGPVGIRSRLLHFGLTDATLCCGEIGLLLYSGSTQVHNGEGKNDGRKVMVCEELCPHYNWTICSCCRISLFPLNQYIYASVPWLNCGVLLVHSGCLFVRAMVFPQPPKCLGNPPFICKKVILCCMLLYLCP